MHYKLGLNLFNRLKQPLFLFFVIALFKILESFGTIPGSEKLLFILENAIEGYGIWIVGLFALFESIVVVNSYVPGAIFVLSSMALTSGNPSLAIMTYFVISFSLLFGYFIDYFLGYHFSMEISKRLDNSFAEDRTLSQKQVFRILLVTMWHPQFGSYASYFFGTKKIAPQIVGKFLLIANTIWTLFWGLTMYFVGSSIVESGRFLDISLLAILLWIIYEVLDYKKRQLDY